MSQENKSLNINKFSNGFIFCNNLTNVLMIKHKNSNLWKGLISKLDITENHTPKNLTKDLSEITGVEIKQESWKDITQIVNLDKTIETTVYMTVISNIECLLTSKKTDIELRIFPVFSLTTHTCPISQLWRIFMCLDSNVCGMLSRIIYYS